MFSPKQKRSKKHCSGPCKTEGSNNDVENRQKHLEEVYGNAVGQKPNNSIAGAAISLCMTPMELILLLKDREFYFRRMKSHNRTKNWFFSGFFILGLAFGYALSLFV